MSKNWQSLKKFEYCGLTWTQTNLLLPQFFQLSYLFFLTKLCILKSGPHFDETKFFLGWQKGNTSGVDLKPSIQP